MSNGYCSNCGSALQPGAAFCAECGTPVKQPAQQQPVQQAVQQPVQQPAQQAAYAPAYAYGAQKRTNKGLVIGLAAGGAALFLLLAVILIVVFASPKGALKDYRMGDVIGYYEGKATVKSVKISGSWKQYAEAMDADFDELEDMIDEARGSRYECELYLERGGLTLTFDDLELMMGESSIYIEDFELKKGRAKGKAEESEEYYLGEMSKKINYDVTLKEDKRNDYGLSGKVKVELTTTIDHKEMNYYLDSNIKSDFKMNITFEVEFDTVQQ